MDDALVRRMVYSLRRSQRRYRAHDGWLVDRYTARRFLPLFLLLMAVGNAVLATSSSPWAVPVFMFLGALTNGAASTLIAAVWVELFGTRHLGSIRRVAFAGQILASALAPGLIGLLLDSKRNTGRL